MHTFLLSFDATTTITGSAPPTLEVLIGGVPVSSVEMQSGANSYNVFVDFTGAAPSSVTLRFAGTSGNSGDSISFTAVSINDEALDTSTDLTATLLTQAQTSGVTAAASIFGHTTPTIGPPTVTGTAGDDSAVQGSSAADTIDGLAGNDRILGYGDDDAINGGGGDDVIFGQAGADTIIGGAGNDVIYGNEDNDILFGEADNDYLIGGAGDDILNGGAGNDGLIGEAGNDVIFGEGGDDWLIGDAGDDILIGDDGNDIIVGGADNDALSGGLGTDQLIGGAGNDLMSGGDDDDELIGEGGNDTIEGDDGDDLIIAGAGADIIDGGANNDTINGGDGIDTIDGGTGNDVMFGDNDSVDVGLNVASMVSYGGSQDVGGTFSDITGGVLMDGNLWKKIQVDYTVTANTVIEFDFMSTNEAEVSAIGFDNDDTIDSNASFKVYGTQAWGRTNYEDYDGSGEWMHFEIDVGSFYTGTFSHLFLVNDDDGTGDDGDGSWRNLTISEVGTDNADVMDGESGNDRLYGHGGNDTLEGGDDDDIVYGGAGNDTIGGGAGDDTVFGGAGNDTIYGETLTPPTIMEAGREAVTQTSSTQWHSVSFTDTIENAVVKMFAEDITGDPFTIRVRDITDSGFEFQLDEYDYQNGSTVLENISWIAVAEGTHTLDNGLEIQAGFVTATNETATSVSFNSSITSPVVFTQVSSDNELSAVVTRNDNVTTTGFDVQMQEEEANANTHATEDIGWIAIQAGGSVASGILAGTTGDSVIQTNTTVSFGGTFGSTPAFLADMQTLDGGDTAVAAGGAAISTTQAQVYIDEEASNDAEINHTTEDVGYIALEEGVYVSQIALTGSDILRGGDGDDTIYADVEEDTGVLDGSAANPLASAILNDNPDAYWNLGESSGTTADNQGSIGSAVDGTINGGPTLGSAALYTGGGTAIDFDGTNDGILIPDDAGINTSTYAERTVELVFNADDVTTRQVLWEEGGTTNGLTIYLDGGNVYATGEDDGDWADANINASVSTGTTYHIAFVFDQPNNSFEGFLDGTSIGSVTVNNAVFPGHSGDIGIGYAPDGVQFHDGENGSGGYYFDGRISDVALYNRALSSTEIQEHADIVGGTLPSAGTIDDTLYGGDGFDQLYGGEGRDVFVFESASAFNDVDEINGFDVGEQDAIDISDILTGYTAGVSDINDFVQISVSGGDSTISVDANGTTGGASFSDIAQINNFSGATVDQLLANHSIIPV